MSMPRIRQILDLSTSHLPFDHWATVLDTVEGVVAYELDYGWLMWVPDDPDDSDEGDGHVLPGSILKIQRYARKHGCDYVLFDRDAEVDPALPTWEW